MKTATFSEFRNNAKEYFDIVESGESIEIYRHGKPAALLVPCKKNNISRWKESRPLKIPGASLSSVLIENRKDSI